MAFSVHVKYSWRNVYCNLTTKDGLAFICWLCLCYLCSFLNPSGDFHSEQQYQQQKFSHQSSGPPYRKDQYFPREQNRGERGRGRGGWQGGHQSASEEIPRYITGLYIQKKATISRAACCYLSAVCLWFCEIAKIRTDAVFGVFSWASVFPDFLQNTDMLVFQNERPDVVQWVLSDFQVEKLHLLVMRGVHFAFCLPIKWVLTVICF